MTVSVYPSIEELISPIMEARLPVALVKELTERYETLGEKYLTDEVHTDGRRINGMMFTDRNLNCREEIIDAIFCIIGWVFKFEARVSEPHTLPDGSPDFGFFTYDLVAPTKLYQILDGLILIYTMLREEEYNGTYS